MWWIVTDNIKAVGSVDRQSMLDFSKTLYMYVSEGGMWGLLSRALTTMALQNVCIYSLKLVHAENAPRIR